MLAPTCLLGQGGTANADGAYCKATKRVCHDTRGLIDFLPATLNLPKETLDQTLQHTCEDTQLKQEKTQKTAFTPHAMILTRDGENSHSILISALVNSRRYLRIDFPQDVQATEYVGFAFKEIENKKGPVNQFYEGITGVSINYTSGHARTFDLDRRLLSESRFL